MALALVGVAFARDARAADPPPSPPIRFEVLAAAGARDLRVGANTRKPEGTAQANIPLYGAGAGIGLVKRTRPIALMGSFRYELGSTSGGLRSHVFLADVDAGLILSDRATFFFGTRIGEVIIERVTSRGPLIAHWGIGGVVGLNLDLFGRVPVLFVRPQVDALVIPHALLQLRTVLFGGGLDVGVRF